MIVTFSLFHTSHRLLAKHLQQLTQIKSLLKSPHYTYYVYDLHLN